MGKNHRNNTNFQIRYFLAGMCHTPDGAYAVLCDLLEDRELAVKTHRASLLKTEASRLRAKRLLESDDEIVRLDGEAALAEIESVRALSDSCYAAALDEVDYIKCCMEELQPLRKYAYLPDAQAHEISQAEEWRLELIHRAENYLVTSGTIPADHLATMRAHPDFHESIAPAIEALSERMKCGGLSLLELSKPTLGIREVI
jgi:hypothetical protein